MSRHVPFLFTLAITIACSNNNKTSATNEATDSATKKAADKTVDPAQAKTETLTSTTPMDLDELKDYLPTQLEGMKRNNFSMSSSMGYATAHADYEKNKRTDVRVVLYDCAGEAGAALYNSTYAAKMNVPTDSSSKGYNKNIVLLGNKAIEHFDKVANATTLTFMVNERLMAVLTGRNIPAETLEKAAEQIKK
ncbi:MAG: hypothetical protein V4676_05730 [Bacteroidota bacterium]